MKITILGPAWPYRGGIAAFNERLAKELQSEGDDVNIVTFTLQYPSFLFPGKTQYTDAPKPNGLEIKRELSSINPYTWVKTGLDIKSQAPDLLVMRYWLPVMAPALRVVASIAKSNHHTKVIVVTDNIIPHEKRIGDKQLTQLMVDGMDGFIVMSDVVLRDLSLFDKIKPRKLSPHPIYDIYGSPIDKTEARKHLNITADKVILFFGLIRDYKGLDLLLGALGKLKTEGVKLVVAGEFYNNREQYMEQARSLCIEDSIDWHTEWVKDEDVRYYFSAADLIVQPYKSATQSGVTQIAYQMGRAMLVTNVGGLTDIVKDGVTGYTVGPNEDAIANGIDDFFINNRMEEMERNVIRERKKYEWGEMTKQIKNLLK